MDQTSQARGQTPDETRPVVVVGASAGGLEALTRMLKKLRPDTGMRFVVIQHLSPDRPSQLSEILARSTAMPVSEAREGARMEANHIYVIPPGTSMFLQGGALHLEARKPVSHRLPIDRFMESVAAELGTRGIAVILSGTGSDGARGLKAIKSEGGVTFAQDDASAKFAGMPQSAAATGAADFILPPEGIADELNRVSWHPYVAAAKPVEAVEDVPEDDGNLKRIFAALHSATRIDFSAYKLSTIKRRLSRRMMVNQIDSLDGYVRYIQDHPAEITCLYRDILIHVTSFFREPDTYDAITRLFTESLLERGPEDAIRVWVAGCATGEEAYSIAICLQEALAEAGRRTPVQIFGTDVSEEALETARAGFYPEGIKADVSFERLQRFFTREDGGYRINKQVRECCIFARHDLTKDPPFSRLDIVSCRNVLIYMRQSLQKHILPVLHYSLKPFGLLMLGSAESIADASNLFLPVDREHRIYRKRPSFAHVPWVNARAAPHPVPEAPAEETETETRIQTLTDRIFRDRSGTDGLIVNGAMQIVEFRGRVGPYLDPVSGRAGCNLLRMVGEDLGFRLRRMIARAAELDEPVQEKEVPLSRDHGSARMDVEVIPVLPAAHGDRHYAVLFTRPRKPEVAVSPAPAEPVERPAPAGKLEDRIVQLERELTEARSLFRTVTEEHEASTEELRAANEEIRSANEELQSTNEELASAKEELQSTNEELITVNEELRNTNQELTGLSDDLKNLLTAVQLPIVMVGNDLRVRRFTPAASRLMNLLPSDIGRPILHIRSNIEIPKLEDLLKNATDNLNVETLELEERNGRWYSLVIRPYRTGDNRIEGAVMVFSDVDTMKRSLQEAQQARKFAEGILETIWEPLVVLDTQLRVQFATPAFYQVFHASPGSTQGRRFFELANGQWNLPRLQSLLDDVITKNSTFSGFEIDHSFPEIGYRNLRLNARQLRGRSGDDPVILLAIDDVTERRESSEIRYRRLFETAKDGVLVVSAENGEILDANPFFFDMTGSSRDELAGKKLWETDAFKQSREARLLVDEAKDREIVRYDNVLLLGANNLRINAEVVANRYSVGTDQVIQLNVRDITARKRMEDELRRSNEDLMQFAYAASHDLQEPLRTVSGYAQLLEKKYVSVTDEDTREILHFIRTGVARMSQMIRDLLMYSRMGGGEIMPEPVEAESLVAWAVNNLQLAIADSGAIVTNDPLPRIEVDQMQFIQLFQNLISNSLKYRREEPPHIHISARREGNEWVFSIADNGQGFDPAKADRIFGVFKRLHGRDYPGTGIGLAITRKILERHGGRIWADSTPGQGSTFYFTVPME